MKQTGNSTMDFLRDAGRRQMGKTEKDDNPYKEVRRYETHRGIREKKSESDEDIEILVARNEQQTVDFLEDARRRQMGKTEKCENPLKIVKRFEKDGR